MFAVLWSLANLCSLLASTSTFVNPAISKPSVITIWSGCPSSPLIVVRLERIKRSAWGKDSSTILRIASACAQSRSFAFCRRSAHNVS